MWVLTATDMSELGGPMGTDRTSTLFQKFYTDADYAKEAAEKHYKRPIQWVQREGSRNWTSGDLGWVMYTVKQVKIEH